MRDLTQGPIGHHILVMAMPVAVSMLAQIAYQLIDLYFVTRLGTAAIAGVNAAGNAALIGLSLTQMLGVGSMALVANAVGRKDFEDANLIFNQSLVLSLVCGVVVILIVITWARPYLNLITKDAAVVDAGVTFVHWMLPGYILQFPMVTLTSALRGLGIVKPTLTFYLMTVVLNSVLAPILIAGWGTGSALGVKGAALGTSISVCIGVICLGLVFSRSQRFLRARVRLLSPRPTHWLRVVRIGLPAGFEMIIGFLSGAVVYYAMRGFDSSAQAGFGIESRILQTILMPGMAIAMAVAPIVGQSLGAQKFQREGRLCCYCRHLWRRNDGDHRSRSSMRA